MDPNWSCRPAVTHLWAVFQEATSPTHLLLFPAGTHGPKWWSCQHGTITGSSHQHLLCPPCPSPAGQRWGERAHNVPHYFQHTELWFTPLFHLYGGCKLYTIAEQPREGRGSVRSDQRISNFPRLLFISHPFTATKNCTLFSTSHFQESLTSNKMTFQHINQKQHPVIGCYPTSLSTRWQLSKVIAMSIANSLPGFRHF